MANSSTRRATLLLTLLLAVSGCGWKLVAREAPDAEPANAGATMLAPSFSLPGEDGVFVTLDELLAEGRPAVVVFYRGHW
jgi:cytochrome oxidase Cu insertion factor (SCO1/SenC/PrrC family)